MAFSHNPIPDLQEAGTSFARMVTLKAELILLDQELKTIRRTKQLLWLGAAGLVFLFNLGFAIFWIEFGIHERGLDSLWLSLISFLCLGVVSLLCLFVALKLKAPQ